MRRSAPSLALGVRARLFALPVGGRLSLRCFSKLSAGKRALVAAGFSLVIAACGGGGGGATQPPPVQPWSEVQAWPLIAIHAVLTPGGNVLTYGSDADGRRTASFIYDVWDPTLGPNAHTTLANRTGTDIFCSAQVLLPQTGNVFIAGGDRYPGTGDSLEKGIVDTTQFAPATNALTKAAPMSRERWYASITTLPSGEQYIQGGLGEDETDPDDGHEQPELRKADGSFQTLDIRTAGLAYSYPRNFVAPDGRIFGFDVDGRMYFVSADLQTLTRAGNIFPSDFDGNAELGGAGAALYAPGKVLLFGGSRLEQALIIDFDVADNSPAITPVAPPSSRRDLVNATLLADGSVLATGGSGLYNALQGVTNQAEIWHPDTSTWSVGPSAQMPRLYHSVGLLLPDATVLVAGGGANGPVDNFNAEIYRPPYLFSSSGALAARPSITSAPASIAAGIPFNVSVGSDQISRVTLIKTGSVTHSWNMDQRFVPVTFNQPEPGAALTVTPPANRYLMTPGYYLLFVFNSAGVPSVAKIVQVPAPAS